MDKAAVFSKVQRIIFPKPITREKAAQLLQEYVLSVGTKLSYNAIIAGHIKIAAQEAGTDRCLFLSLTRLDQLHMKSSVSWESSAIDAITEIEMTINAHLFGYEQRAVEQAVRSSLSILGVAPRLGRKIAANRK